MSDADRALPAARYPRPVTRYPLTASRFSPPASHFPFAVGGWQKVPWHFAARVAAFVVVAFFVGSRPARAITQAPGDEASVGAAGVARAAWGRGMEALRKGDIGAARLEMDSAAAAWPTQQAYVWGRAIVAARAGDTTELLAALKSYAALGLGRDLLAAKDFERFSKLPEFRALVAAHDANRRPLVRSRPLIALTDSTFWPEGIDYDARNGRFCVASVRHRTIEEVTTDGKSREVWPAGQQGIGAVLGVRVDAARNVLWATLAGIPQMAGYTPADSTIAALVRVRMSDGAIDRRWDLPIARGGHALGDLAIGPAGDVFVTDSYQPVLYRLRPGTDTLERFVSPLFRSLQGVAPTPDGRALYLADYSHGMLRIDLRDGRVVRLVDAPGSTSLGCDGIVWDDGSLIAVQNGVSPARVMRFVLDDTGKRIVRAEVLDRNVSVADEPTIGTIAGRDFVYVANSQWEKYDNSGRVKPGAWLAPPILLAIPLDAAKAGQLSRTSSRRASPTVHWETMRGRAAHRGVPPSSARARRTARRLAD
jgi:sugar lactone lactonase YvrE